MATVTQIPWFLNPESYLQPWQQAIAKSLAIPKVIDVMRRTRVGATPTRPVYREDGLRLLEYETEAPRSSRRRCCWSSLVNRSYIVDLRPGKSVIHHSAGRV